jgi:retron-type reverse transcriptase
MGSTRHLLALPVKRRFIPMPDGSPRPLGITALEDKIVPRAVATLLGSSYEQDCRGFSYGFRSGRCQHDALDARVVGISSQRVNWILDANIRSYFDKTDLTWSVKMLEHRIGAKA